jgi:diacylglycerol kinase family enzyme
MALMQVSLRPNGNVSHECLISGAPTNGDCLKKIVALLNPHSGSVPKDAAAALDQALAELGQTASIEAFEDGDLQGALKRAIDQSPDVLIVWGGDGSVNCALGACGPDGPPVLALPGGTMNLVHQRLHNGRTQWQDMMTAAMSDPEIVPWTAGEIEGRRFYVAVMVGRVTTLSESRELVRKGALFEAITAAAKNEVFNMETRLNLYAHRGSGSVITPATAGAIVLAGERRPRFEVAAIDPSSQLDLVSVGFQSLISGWRDAEDVTVEIASKVTLEDVHGEPIPATIDEEPFELPPMCDFRLVPDSARVVRAKPSV